MNYSIATTMRRLLFPRHRLSCSWFVWWCLVRALRERGRAGTRESGAFLLGKRQAGYARIADFVLYDDLDPHCLETGIVRFDGRYYGALWAHAERTQRSVVADVHVHPGEARQSDSDRQHPMVAQAGHIALILPWYAKPPLPRSQIRAYVFKERNEWHAIPSREICSFFHVGL